MTGAHPVEQATSQPLSLTALQQRKLRRLLIDAAKNVPFYRQLYNDCGLSVRDLASPSILEHLPVLTKGDLLGASLEQRRNIRFQASDLSVESTTGSSGQPFSLYVEMAYQRRRNWRFLRALFAAGYRPWQRLMLLTDRHSAPLTRIGNRYYVSVEQATDTIFDAYLSVRPAFLYGFATPLRLLAEKVAARPAGFGPVAVVSTAEMLDTASRGVVAAAFACPVHDFYGLTEMGLVAWQRPGANYYNSAGNSVLMEFVPQATGDGRYRMIMTNLELRASPIIRFDSGDLVSMRLAEGRPRIEGIEGRCIDTIVCRDGAELSPYRITDAMRNVSGLRRFKVTQSEVDDLIIDLEVDAHDRENASQHAKAIFEKLLGPDVRIVFRYHEALIADGTRKFRPVESKVLR